jgi:hypothetical protein
MLPSSGDCLAHDGLLPLFHDHLTGPIRLAQYHHIDTTTQQLPKTRNMVELHAPLARAGSATTRVSMPWRWAKRLEPVQRMAVRFRFPFVLLYV